MVLVLFFCSWLGDPTSSSKTGAVKLSSRNSSLSNIPAATCCQILNKSLVIHLLGCFEQHVQLSLSVLLVTLVSEMMTFNGLMWKNDRKLITWLLLTSSFPQSSNQGALCKSFLFYRMSVINSKCWFFKIPQWKSWLFSDIRCRVIVPRSYSVPFVCFCHVLLFW